MILNGKLKTSKTLMKHVHVSYFCAEDLANGSSGVSVVRRDLARSLIHGIYGKSS